MQGNNNMDNSQTTVIPLGTIPDPNSLQCPHCGLTDLTLDESTGHYTCNTCQYEFKPVKDEYKNPPKINQNITVDTSNLVTLKCSYCKTEVTIDNRYAGRIKCHWCRCTLSPENKVETKIPPRTLLTFTTTREEALKEIEKYIKDKKIFALADFKNRLKPENIMCTYFPYVVVDSIYQVALEGQGEHTVKKDYDVHAGNVTYEADDYIVSREYNFYIDGLMVENYKPKQKNKKVDPINNIISMVKPFDIENSIDWNPNYLGGCTSQNRDIDFNILKPISELQSKNLAKFVANETLEEYDRGVMWSKIDLVKTSEYWKIVYLPVWLYGYKMKDDNTFYYIAVNGRTKKTTGNIPIDTKKLLVVSIIAELIGIILMLLMANFDLKFIFLLLGLGCYFIIKQWYSKSFSMSNQIGEDDKPKTYIYNLKQEDKVMQRKTGLKTTSMVGANNTDPIGTNTDVIYDQRDKTGKSNKEFTKQR